MDRRRWGSTVAGKPHLPRVVERDGGSEIDPPLDQDWPEIDKLRWKLGLVLVEGGMAERWIEWGVMGAPGDYTLAYPRGLIGPFDFRGMWDFLNGVGVGLTAR